MVVFVINRISNQQSVLPTAGSATENSAPGVSGGPSLAQQFAISYGVGRLYDASIGPLIRQGTEKILQKPHTPAYKPPNTIPYLVRDVAYTVSAFLLGQHAFAWLSRGSQQGGATNMLTTASGVSGATAGAIAGKLTLGAVKSMVGQTALMTLLFSTLDAVFANKLGPAIEGGVNTILGKKRKSTNLSTKDGTVPTNSMRTSGEQFTRNLVRNFCSGMTYALVLRTVGSQVAASIAGTVGGPAGALIAGIAVSLVASQIAGYQDQFFGRKISSLAQTGLRTVKKSLGLKLDKKIDTDVVPVTGDRVSGSVRGVVVPFLTALASGQQQGFMRSITSGVQRNA